MAGSSWASIGKLIVREAAREQREWARQNKAKNRARAKVQQAEAKIAEKERARLEVSAFENQIRSLTSKHHQCSSSWDWDEVVSQQAPPPPQPENTEEIQAQKAADSYIPGFFTRFFGMEKRARAKLSRKVEEARGRDNESFEAAYKEYQSMKETHDWLQQIGRAIPSGDLNAYRSALDRLLPVEEINAGISVRIEALRLDVVVLECVAQGSSIVPKEEKKLTSTGKLSTKKMAAGRYWGVYQDFVCGCALRVAREVFGIVPIPRVVVNVAVSGLDSNSGNEGTQTILAISLPREVAATLVFAAIDPSDSLKLYPHRTKFKKTVGFAPVEPIGADESFITTGPRP